MILRCCRLPALTVLVAGILSLESAAQQPAASITNTLTLDEAVQLALTGNPEIKASVARVEAAAGRACQAKKWSNPELELNAEEWPASGGRGFADAKQTIGISQVLPYPGKKALDVQVGGANVRLSEAQMAVRRTEIVRDVKAGFFRVLAAERMLAVAAQLAAVAQASAAVASNRVEAGAAAFQEQLRAELQWEQARVELAGFEREAATARQMLAALLGRPEMRDARLEGVLAETPNAALLAADGAAANHPSLSAARANLEQTRLAYRRARLEPYPDVKVVVSGGQIGESDASIIQVGFSLPLPLLDGGKGRQQEAQANVRAAEAELLLAQQQLQREWANAQKRYRAAAHQTGQYRDRILPKAGAALALVQAGFAQGKFSFMDLLDIQRTTAETQLTYQQKLLELNLAQAELEALLQPQTNPTKNRK